MAHLDGAAAAVAIVLDLHGSASVQSVARMVSQARSVALDNKTAGQSTPKA